VPVSEVYSLNSAEWVFLAAGLKFVCGNCCWNYQAVHLNQKYYLHAGVKYIISASRIF